MKCATRALVVVSLVLGAVGSAKAGSIYSENFDTGAPGFTFNGLWHVTSNFPFSGANALGYVQGETPNSSTADGNYDNGSANSATAFSPAIALPTGTLTLTFEAFNHNEFGDEPDFFDRLRVGISTDGSSLGTIVASSSSFDGAPVGIPIWTPDNTGYNFITVNISSFAGQTIYLAFNYDTLDAIDNDHPGARIDDVRISAVPEPTSLTLFGAATVGCLGYVGYRRRKETAAHSPGD
jgi:hypothetical protein